MTDRPAIVAAARQRLGMRFQHQAAADGVACDCIGLLVLVARSCGLSGADVFATAEFRGYGMAPDPARLLAAAERYLDPLAISAATPGDVFVMAINGEPWHFGILSALAPRQMIHSHLRARGVREVTVDPFWGAKIVRAYAFRAA